MAKTRVLVADDTNIYLTGIITILNSSKTIEVIASTSSGAGLCKLYMKHSPELVLVSANLNDLTIQEIMKRLTKHDPEAKVVVLSEATNVTHLNMALKAGVTGYLVKSMPRQELETSVLKAAGGEKVFSDSIYKLISNRYMDLARGSYPWNPADGITNREREILQMIAEGNTSQEIADQLFISPRTVEKHRANLRRKLNIRNTAGLVRYAIEKGLVSG